MNDNSHFLTGGLKFVERSFSAMGELWCATFHQEISTHMYGHYRCLRCRRVYPVCWELDASAVPSSAQDIHPRPRRHDLRPAVSP